jgi:hypothetical protein
MPSIQGIVNDDSVHPGAHRSNGKIQDQHQQNTLFPWALRGSEEQTEVKWFADQAKLH